MTASTSKTPTVRALLLSAYDAPSHRYWRQRLTSMLADYQWTELCLPARHFSWRIRSNSLEWAFTAADTLDADYKLLVATSMVDLASLRGLRPSLCRIPSLVYFHENQFVYPQHRQRPDNIEPQLVPLYSALCADRVVFNSEYNRSSFLQGVQQLSAKLPAPLPAAALQRLQGARVLPVPLLIPSHVDCEADLPADRAALEVVWNHRWEYDKGPDRLLALVAELQRRQSAIRLHIVGQHFRQQPQEFTDLTGRLHDLARQQGLAPGRFGFVESRQEYLALLQHCDVVLSTARPEFQSLALQEACLAGCTPLAPRAMAYPEYLPEPCLYAAEADPEVCARLIADRLQTWAEARRRDRALPQADLGRFTEQQLQPAYRRLFAECANGE